MYILLIIIVRCALHISETTILHATAFFHLKCLETTRVVVVAAAAAVVDSLLIKLW